MMMPLDDNISISDHVAFLMFSVNEVVALYYFSRDSKFHLNPFTSQNNMYKEYDIFELKLRDC